MKKKYILLLFIFVIAITKINSQPYGNVYMNNDPEPCMIGDCDDGGITGNAPIDDYIPVLVLGGLLMGYVTVNKNKVNKQDV